MKKIEVNPSQEKSQLILWGTIKWDDSLEFLQARKRELSLYNPTIANIGYRRPLEEGMALGELAFQTQVPE